MIRKANLALLLFLPATAFAQKPDPQMAWKTFQKENGQDSWSVNWNQATGTPSAIYGKGLVSGEGYATVEAGRVRADAVLTKYADLLGKGESDFVEVDSSKIRHLLYYNYKQQYKGLDVRGARADVRIHVNGTVAMFGSDAVQIPLGFGVKAAISKAAARKIAEQKILGKAGTPGRQTRLVIWAEPSGKKPTKPVLAWEVEIHEIPANGVNPVAGKVFVDANAGTVLEYEDGIIYCGSCKKTHAPRLESDNRLLDAMAKRKTLEAEAAAAKTEAAPSPEAPPMALTGKVMAWVITGHKPTDPVRNIPLKNLLVTSSAGSVHTDKNGAFSIPYTGTSNVTVSATLRGKHMQRIRVASGTQMSASASVKPNTPTTVIQFGTATLPEAQKSQTTVYHFTDDIWTYVQGLVPNKPTQFARLDTMNPRVNINSSCNAYYTGMTINFYNQSTQCNMTAYETVIQHEWGHGLDDAFGGIIRTDGLSEGWADVICILRSQQPDVGPSFFKPPRTPSWVRNANNTKTYPQVGGVHTQGEVWMGWVWDVRKELIKTKGTGGAQAITERIVIPTIVANASTLEKQVLEVFLLDDNDGNLKNGTPNYNALEVASLKRKIKFPKIDAGFITHKPLPNTAMQLTPVVVRALATPIIGSFQKVELTYDIGGGAVTREMVKSGTANEYIALIPGVVSPKTTKYHISALHSTNKVFRVPDTGEYDFATGKEVTFLFDDFEGTNKWTTGGTASDFARGKPAGATGNTANTNWADPKAAFSGNNSWGNDIGLTGKYNSNQASFLRSPKIDLTGKANVRLRYWRWLTVMQGFWDKAEIFVGSTKEWNNTLGATTVDTGWVKQDIRLASADNKKDVQVEFRMTSDGDFELGGWNIDDVAVYAFEAIPAPKFRLDINPSMVDLGKNSTATFTGTASKPILILVSASGGPTNIPGLPTLHVGAPWVGVGAALNSSGKLTLNFTAPSSTSATGMLTYVHALEQTSATKITASNAGIVLWGK